ncbi:MAG: PH domain-containing protein [Bacteroidia bacterium]
MEKFTASRLTSGNKMFPLVITIDEIGVTLKMPSLFSGSEKTIPFSRISSVNIDCPLIGFSTIIIETTGEGSIRAHGFTKKEVLKMKELMLSKA